MPLKDYIPFMGEDKPFYGYGEQAVKTFSDPKNIVAILGTAGATGLLGGYLSSKTPGPLRETPQQRRKRVLKNALLAAGAGGTAMGAGLYGYNTLFNQPAPSQGLIGAAWGNTFGQLGGRSKAYLAGAGIGGAVNNYRAMKADSAAHLANLAQTQKVKPDQLRALVSAESDPTIRSKVVNNLAEKLTGEGMAEKAKGLPVRGAGAQQIEGLLYDAGLNSNLSTKERLGRTFGRYVHVHPDVGVASGFGGKMRQVGSVLKNKTSPISLAPRGRSVALGAGAGAGVIGAADILAHIAMSELNKQ